MSEKYLGQLDTLSNLFEKVTNDAAATLKELDISRRQIADLKARLADANRGAQVNALVNESLAKKLKLAVDALGHYADKSNWDANKGFANDVWYLTERGWSIADETLAKIKEPSKGRDV